MSLLSSLRNTTVIKTRETLCDGFLVYTFGILWQHTGNVWCLSDNDSDLCLRWNNLFGEPNSWRDPFLMNLKTVLPDENWQIRLEKHSVNANPLYYKILSKDYLSTLCNFLFFSFCKAIQWCGLDALAGHISPTGYISGSSAIETRRYETPKISLITSYVYAIESSILITKR